MKIETQLRDDQQMQVIAEFESSVFEDYKRRAARQISKEVKIPGFRPGKAPYDVVKRLYGEEAIEKEATQIMLDDVYPKVLEEAKIDPSGPGSLDQVMNTNPPKFSFIIPLQPEVTLPEYHSIRKEYHLEPVTDEDVNKSLENIKMSYGTAEPVQRPAQDGDLVSLKVSGQLMNPAENENPEFIKESPLQVIVGREDAPSGNWPYDGFTKELVGLSANEEKEIKYTYSEDSPFDKLRGKTASFKINVQNVKSMKLPELTDEFAQTLGEFDTVEKLIETIRKNMEQSRKNEYDSDYSTSLVDTIVSQSTVKYPSNVLEHEMEHVVEAFQQDLAERKMDLDTYLKTRQVDKPAFLENEVKPAARKRLERSLVLDEIAKAEKIEIKSEELQNAVTQTLGEMEGQVDLSKIKTKAAQRNFTTALTYETAGRLINQRVMDRLKAIATGQLESTETPILKSVENTGNSPETNEENLVAELKKTTEEAGTVGTETTEA